MAKTKGMTDSELVSLLDRAIATANNYEGSEAASARNAALEFVKGEVDLPSEAGKSSVVSHDVADTLHWVLPQLLRVFLGSENIGIYEPRRREMVQEMLPGPDGQPVPSERDVSEERAQQATDYVNYALMNDCRGYSVLHSALYDGLLFGNGIIKHWWDDTPVHVTEDFSGLAEDAFIGLVDDDDVEVLEHTQYDDPDWTPPPMPEPEQMLAMAGAALHAGVPEEQIAEGAAQLAEAMSAPQLHDVKIKRRIANGSLQVRALPHEEFFIGPDDLVIDEQETYLCGHAYKTTRSELIRTGYSRDKVEEISDASDSDMDESANIRRGPIDEVERDRSTQEVDVFECYIRVDYDGDGIAEWRKVVMGGKSGGYVVLDNEEWGDDLPFTDLIPDPVPHRWQGRSLFDETADIQRIKSQLLRQTLDNLYRVNNPQRVIKGNNIQNMDVLVNQEIGGVVVTTGDPRTAVHELVVPFVAGQSFPMVEFMDRIRAMRTGVSDQSMGLDPDALQNQTATASNFQQAAAYSKMETYARNVAEVGMKRLFRCLLRLVTKHQDRTRVVRLRGQWVEMDPRAWHADMDVTINTGLGSGSREKDMAVINGILNEQKLIIQQGGPFNPIADIRKYRDTLAKMVELSGLKSPDRYFDEISDEQFEQMKKSAETPSDQPDPRMIEAQGKLQIEHMKAQQKAQADQQQFALDMEKTQLELQALREKMAIELEMMRQESAEKMRLMREEAEQKFALKMREMEIERELGVYRIASDANAHNATNIPSPV